MRSCALSCRSRARPMDDYPLAVITREGLSGLIVGLRNDGFRVIGPRLRDEAIVYDDIETVADLPAGWTDEQDGGHYRVLRRDDAALFGYEVGPHAWKRFLHPPLLRLWRAEAECRRRAGHRRRRSRRSASVPCGAVLRVARHRHPGPGSPGRAAMSIRITRRGGRACSSSR